MKRIELLSHLKQNGKCFVGDFPENRHSLKFVEELYASGASQVFVVDGMGDNEYYDTIFVKVNNMVPPDLIVAVFNSHADECALCPDDMNCFRLWWD
jgi:hypothetical protein